MQSQRDKNIILKYTLSGFVIGLATVLLVLFMDFIIRDLTWDQILETHGRNPVYIILDLSPLVLALYGYLLSRGYAYTATNLNQIIQQYQNRINRVHAFVEELRKGNTDAGYQQEEDDHLGGAILSLRDELRKNQEEEAQRRKEDQQRHWVSEGLAQFGDILREDTNNLEELSHKVISNLVKYCGVVQGEIGRAHV